MIVPSDCRNVAQPRARPRVGVSGGSDLRDVLASQTVRALDARWYWAINTERGISGRFRMIARAASYQKQLPLFPPAKAEGRKSGAKKEWAPIRLNCQYGCFSPP
jgi:hypothetical protein